MQVGDLAIDTVVIVPAALSPAEAVLPALRALVDVVVDAAQSHETGAGREISCRKGCSACCYQLVPISRTEAREIVRLVDAQPVERQAELRRRFSDAARRLREAGLSNALLAVGKQTDHSRRALGSAYFELNIACPFLDNDSCSIHADRPMTCREYLVTSPAQYCSEPDHDRVVTVGVPKLSVAVRGLEAGTPTPAVAADWVPLALALEIPAQATDARRNRSGPDWLKRYFAAMQAAGSGEI